MWTRQELKEKGKAAFKANYWKSVVAGLVAMMLGSTSYYTVKESSDSLSAFRADVADAVTISGLSLDTILAILLGIVGISLVIGLVVNAFLRNPLLVGTKRYFLKNAQQPAELGELGYAFREGRYMTIVAAKFLADLFIFLWSLLLVIPGVIKSYEYYLVNYILADDPDMEPMEALGLSREMMRGHKWNTFVLELSFIGWHFLGAITFGLLNIFYVTPYVEATGAELYRALKQQYR